MYVHCNAHITYVDLSWILCARVIRLRHSCCPSSSSQPASQANSDNSACACVHACVRMHARWLVCWRLMLTTRRSTLHPHAQRASVTTRLEDPGGSGGRRLPRKVSCFHVNRPHDRLPAFPRLPPFALRRFAGASKSCRTLPCRAVPLLRHDATLRSL